MTALRFESERAFAIAVAARMIPDDVARQPVRFSRVPKSADDPSKGDEIVVDAAHLDDGVIDRLVGAGASRTRLPKSAAVAPYWPSIVKPVRAENVDASLVLFAVTSGAPASGLALAAHLLSLGGRSIEIASSHLGEAPVTLIRVREPSWYVLSRALDREDGLLAFAPATAESGVIWIELGFAHPALAALRPDAGEIVLVDREGALSHARPTAFQDVNEAIDLALAPAVPERAPVPLPRHAVRLKLGRATTRRTPTLWVLRENGVRALDRLVEEAPEALLYALSFVAIGDPRAPIVVLRATGSGPPPLLFEGEAYAAIPELGDVFIPTERRVHPPVGPHRLRAVVGGPDDRLRWLADAEGGVRVETVPHSAFSPLADWVELAASHADLEPWVQNVSFDPIAFQAHAENASEAKPAKDPHPDSSRPRRRRERAQTEPGPVVTLPQVAEARATRPRPAREEAAPAPAVRTPSDERLLEEAEARLGEADLPLASPERDDAWMELARLYANLSYTDARLAYARVVLSAPELAADAATGWLEAALRNAMTTRERAWGAASSGDPKNQATVELTAALTVASTLSGPRPNERERDQALQVLDGADATLDIRTAWLAHEALAQLSGGDTLLLARARDRALSRLERGLSLERDFPRAVRRLDASSLATLTSADRARVLGDILRTFESTRRKRSALEADPALTMGYVKLVFGCAFARSGDATKARTCVTEAAQTLKAPDGVTEVLTRSFAARVESALEGGSESAPLPQEVIALYAALGRLDRYKVDRMRAGSKLLEPDPDLDPFRAFGSTHDASLASIKTRVANAGQPSEAARALDEGLSAAEAESDPAKRFEKVSAVLSALLYAPPAVGSTHLDRIGASIEGLAAEDRVRSLASIMAAAEQLESPEIVRATAARIPAALADLAPRALASVVPHLARIAPLLRRCGAGKDFESALRSILDGLRGSEPALRAARLTLGRSLVDLDAPEGVGDILEEELEFAERADLSPADRVLMVRSAASCAAGIGDVAAVARLAHLWPRMTDNYNTNSHFCLSAVEIADAVAWALAPRRGDSSSLARRLADEDEHAVRGAIFARLGPASRRR